MHKERLLKLAELLEADAANPTGLKFDLGLWGQGEEDDDGSSEIVSISCNTSACAMGLAVLSGAFADAGLINGSIYKSQIIPAMQWSGNCGFDAAAELFDISGAKACFLFSADRYPPGKNRGADGELAVASRIREFVADHSPEDTSLTA